MVVPPKKEEHAKKAHVSSKSKSKGPALPKSDSTERTPGGSSAGSSAREPPREDVRVGKRRWQRAISKVFAGGGAPPRALIRRTQEGGTWS